MGEKEENPIIHGVQILVLVGRSDDPLDQKILLVRDFNDRGRGDSIRKYGLPGGGIDPGEGRSDAAVRETFEEAGLSINAKLLQEVGCFQKFRRKWEASNNNYLFAVSLDYTPECKTNDTAEVSSTHILEIKKILSLAEQGLIHEGTIRLLFHYLNGNLTGTLDQPVSWRGYFF